MRAIDRAQLFGAIGLQREPGLERAKAARQIGPEIARPGRAGGKAPRFAAQIGRRRGKRLAVLLAVAHHQEAGVVGHLPPFVEIERDRIRVFDSGQPRRQLRRENAERAIGAVDVKPELLLAAQRAQRREIVDRADIHRAGRADHEERLQAGLAVQRDLRAQRGDVDAVQSIDRDDAQRIAAEARNIHRLGDAAMRRRRGIGRQQRALVADAALPDRLSQRRRSRHQHRHQIGHRRAGDENPARLAGKPNIARIHSTI